MCYLFFLRIILSSLQNRVLFLLFKYCIGGGGVLFLVHSSQQREERTKKRRRSYRAFGFVATVAVGVCGTRFARTVLALFPPSSLQLHRPIKAESGDLACILTSSPCGHSPYIPVQKHRGRGGLTLLLPLLVFLTPLLVATLLSSPLYFLAKTQGRRLDTNNFLSLPEIVSVALESLFLLP